MYHSGKRKREKKVVATNGQRARQPANVVAVVVGPCVEGEQFTCDRSHYLVQTTGTPVLAALPSRGRSGRPALRAADPPGWTRRTPCLLGLSFPGHNENVDVIN